MNPESMSTSIQCDDHAARFGERMMSCWSFQSWIATLGEENTRGSSGDFAVHATHSSQSLFTMLEL